MNLRRLLLGKKLDPLNPDTRGHVALIAFLAWIGLGADGLSSACYGPAEAFLALGPHTHLGLYLALATALTVFVIAIAYNQVIDLFPSGGGGYKAATKLIGPYAGLVSGSALIVDYVLTIAISAASGADALFSLIDADLAGYKLITALGSVGLLLWLNLRGMKESIYFLMPIFLGFFVTHAGLIVYGIVAHSHTLGTLVADTLEKTTTLSTETSWLFVVALFLRAYSVGGGTYTGIEAVSNSVNVLAEPRVRTGHWTMFYMAASLAFTAAGVILLYLLWESKPVEGQTLNAVTFTAIIANFGWSSPELNHTALVVVMLLEAGLLLVAANTGFLGGPAVMASMAADRWLPRQFRQLSNRMVTQNGVFVMGGGALAILMLTGGDVAVLVVLYSINVFLTFSLSLYGLCQHWWEQRRFVLAWKRKFALSLLGFVVCAFILLVLVFEKFGDGGWATILITGCVIGLCLLIHRHYEGVNAALKAIDRQHEVKVDWDVNLRLPVSDPTARTAILLVGGSRGTGTHALHWVLDNFPGQFVNFVFVSVGEVDKQSFDSARNIKTLQTRIDNSLNYFTSYCAHRGLPSASYRAFGADPLEELTLLLNEQVFKDYPNHLCFASKLIFAREDLFTKLLHNHMPLAMQRRLSLDGDQLVIVPVGIPERLTPA